MAKKPDPREEAIILIDQIAQLQEFEKGKTVGESAAVPALNTRFTWMRSFQNCWTGWPNDGKSTFILFLALVKSYVHGWKWCVWSPEMYNAFLSNTGKLILSASDLVDELVFMKTGKPPYKHFKDQYGISQLPRDRYLEALEWINEHFIFIDPKNRRYKDLFDCFRYVHDQYEVQGVIGDPFKNLDHSEEGGGRFDLYLDKLFSDGKTLALERNLSLNWVAHPRNDKDPKGTDGAYKVCTQFMLAGGAAWNNNMDGIFSIHRPYKHDNPNDPRVTFYTLKQRKQQLVGRVGFYKDIEFDFDTNRYYFAGYEPIEGNHKETIGERQAREKGNEAKTGKKGKAKVEPLIDFSESKVLPEATPAELVDPNHETAW